jgi:flavodoxin
LSLAIVAIPWPNFKSTDSIKILIAYYSQAGHTEAMAQAVVEGARSIPDVEVVIKKREVKRAWKRVYLFFILWK